MSDKQLYSLSDVADHSCHNSCWIVVSDKVYDVTKFLSIHPGGEEILVENAGRDATYTFLSKGHSDYAQGLLAKYCIGELVEAERTHQKDD